jgi:hypothetical protein
MKLIKVFLHTCTMPYTAPPPPPLPLSAQMGSGQGKGPLGLWDFPVISSLTRELGVSSGTKGPLGLWDFPVLSSLASEFR